MRTLVLLAALFTTAAHAGNFQGDYEWTKYKESEVEAATELALEAQNHKRWTFVNNALVISKEGVSLVYGCINEKQSIVVKNGSGEYSIKIGGGGILRSFSSNPVDGVWLANSKVVVNHFLLNMIARSKIELVTEKGGDVIEIDTENIRYLVDRLECNSVNID